MNPLYMVGKLAGKQRKQIEFTDERFKGLKLKPKRNDTYTLKEWIRKDMPKNSIGHLENYRIKSRQSAYLVKRDCILYYYYKLFSKSSIQVSYKQLSEIFNLGDHSTMIDVIKRTSHRIKNTQYPEHQKFWDELNK